MSGVVAFEGELNSIVKEVRMAFSHLFPCFSAISLMFSITVVLRDIKLLYYSLKILTGVKSHFSSSQIFFSSSLSINSAAIVSKQCVLKLTGLACPRRMPNYITPGSLKALLKFHIKIFCIAS